MAYATDEIPFGGLADTLAKGATTLRRLTPARRLPGETQTNTSGLAPVLTSATYLEAVKENYAGCAIPTHG